MAITLLLFTAHGFGKECCLDSPERSSFVLKIFVIVIAYGQSAAILWAQLAGHNIYHRQRLLATLPLSQFKLNMVHYLTGAVFLVAGTPLWIITLYVWRSFDLPIEPWLLVFTFLGIVAFLLLSMRNLFPRVLIPVAFVFIIIPGAEHYIRVPLEIMTTPAASIIMAVATLLFGWWVAKLPTPRWAPGWGGSSRSRRRTNRTGNHER